MKKSPFIPIVAITLSGLIFGFINFSKKEQIQEDTQQKPKQNTNTPSKEKRISLKNTRYIKEKTDSTKSSFPKECNSALKDLAQMTSSEYSELLKDKDRFTTFFKEDCLISLKTNEVFTKHAKEANCNMLDPSFEFNEKNIEGPCSSLLFILKATFIADQSSALSFDEMTSDELAANFVQMFFSIDKLNKEKLKENLKLIDALYDRHSDDPSVTEAYLAYLMIGQQITGEKSLNQKIDSIWEQGEGSSFKVDRLAVIKDILNKDFDSAQKTIEKLDSQYPNEPDLTYYQAAYHWKKGNKELASKYLDKAIKMTSKGCSYCSVDMYKQTKQRVQDSEVGTDNIFIISVDLNFENL